MMDHMMPADFVGPLLALHVIETKNAEWMYGKRSSGKGKKNIDFCGRSTHTPLQAPAEEHANVEKEHAKQTVQVEMYVNIPDHSGQVR
jgi:hypothetical protein